MVILVLAFSWIIIVGTLAFPSKGKALDNDKSFGDILQGLGVFHEKYY